MIVTRLTGGLGNQLFQYAVGRCLAHRLNTELKLDIAVLENSKNSHHTFYKLNNFNVIENIATPEEIKSLAEVHEKIEYEGTFIPQILDAEDNSYLTGYWQNEEYFQEIRDILLEDFTLKNYLGKNSAAWQEKILNANCAAAVHVRHGDYLAYTGKNYQGILPVNYYRTCVNELKKICPDVTLFIFSDDIEWCKQNFNFGLPVEFVTGCEQDFEEMYLMSCCKHNIIANSTFSWWGAWLNKNPDKKIFTPIPKYIRAFPNDNVAPEKWIQIPVDYSLALPPMLSVIVYVEDNLSSVNSSLSSVIMQNFRDYEIIIVNNSGDGSEKILRKFAVYPNVTLLNCDPTAGKFFAYNKGLDAARGDYVLFLSAKDFINQDAVRILYSVCNPLMIKKTGKHEIYLTCANYIENLPNIVCANRFLEEDAAGNAVITGIPDKKFALKIDDALQNLNAVAEINIPDNQKLMALATQGINNLVGTKFFKRKFLEENNIRYSTRGGVDSELLFLVDAFMATEKITFVPQLFSGRLK